MNDAYWNEPTLGLPPSKECVCLIACNYLQSIILAHINSVDSSIDTVCNTAVT